MTVKMAKMRFSDGEETKSNKVRRLGFQLIVRKWWKQKNISIS